MDPFQQMQQQLHAMMMDMMGVMPGSHPGTFLPLPVEDLKAWESQAHIPATVRAVRTLLFAHLPLPAELVLYIMDLAEHYPSVRAARRERTVVVSTFPHGGINEAQLYLVTPPLPGPRSGAYWAVKKVIWRIEGKDQGWADEASGQ